MNSTNPSAYFGGTWVEIQGRFLLGRSSAYPAGSTGGEASHKLTTTEMPSHNHSMASAGNHEHAGTEYNGTSMSLHRGSGSTRGYGLTWTDNDLIYASGNISIGANGAHTHTINAAGGGEAHNNMPPYLAVYIWKRTA